MIWFISKPRLTAWVDLPLKDMHAVHNVVVIAGSLRKESISHKVANALAKMAPAPLKLEVATLHGLSFFNQDLEANPPADWLAFREKIRAADAVNYDPPENKRTDPGCNRNPNDV